ncbi:MAG: AAA family ATPase [Desulfuromonas sp.]|nr:AAA family ATPase [Desulfuromonas sp.]
MILRSLKLKNFGRFSDKNYDFRRGMNLVIGPNEAGKSTMMASIPAILFGMRDKKRYLPWGRSQCCDAALLFESQNGNVRIERDILSDYVKLVQSDDMYQEQYRFSGVVSQESHTVESQEYGQTLRQLLGLNDETLFSASLFVGQGDFPTDSGDFERYLRTLLSGFTRCDSEMVLASLHDDYAAITSEDPWQQLTTSPRELEAITESLADLDQKQQHNQDVLLQLELVRQQITALENELEHDRKEHSQGIEYIDWVQQLWADQEDTPSTESDEPSSFLNDECQQLERQLTEAGLPLEIPESLPRLLTEADDVRHGMIALQSEMIPLRDRLQKVIVPDWKRPVLLSAAMLCVVVVTHFFADELFYPLTAVMTVLFIVSWSVYRLHYTKKKAIQDELKQKMATIEQRREQEQLHLAALDDEFEQLGISTSAVELVRMQKMFDTHQETLQRLNEIRRQLSAEESTPVEHGEPVEQPVAQEPSNRHLRPEELPTAVEKLEDLMSSIHQRDTLLLGLVRQEAVLLGRLADSEEEGRTRRQLEQRAEELEEHKQVLRCAVDVLTASLDEFRHSSLQRFELEITTYLRKATLGKYVGVKIEDGFRIRLKSKNGQWVALEQLSRGTIDAACMAIRLALSRFLSPTEHLPFFLDDALVNLDSDRLQEMVAALERLSSDHQIIMFSHDERLHKIAGRRRWHVISLGSHRPRTTIKNKEGAEDGGQLSFL